MTVVGGYELVGRVGVGWSSTVWQARDLRLGRVVALKEVPAAAVANLRAEASVLASLDDEHVVSVYGFFEEAGAAYLVEQWIDGATLSAALAAGGTFSTAQALGVCRGALLGLAHAHERGVVHGDVSAGNVLIDAEGVSRLIDFGRGGSGTPAYRSPEVAAGRAASASSDVYAAAAVLVHLLTGEAVLPPAAAKVDASLRPVLARATSAEPTERYQDAAAFLAALEETAKARFGAAWWTQAGVGSLVAPGVAGLTVIGGEATVVAAAGGGPGVAAAGAAAVRGRPRGLLLGGAAGAAALVIAGVVVVSAAGGDADPERSPDAPESSAAGAVDVAASEPSEPPTKSPAEVLEESEVSGVWTLKSTRVSNTQRNGKVTKTGGKAAPNRTWTFSSDGCTDTRCSGTIVSSSGLEFPYRWNGRTLVVVRDEANARNPKEACYDLVTGEKMSIETSAYSNVYSVSYSPFTGRGDSWSSDVTYEVVSERFFGDCSAQPDDTVASLERQVLTRR